MSEEAKKIQPGDPSASTEVSAAEIAQLNLSLGVDIPIKKSAKTKHAELPKMPNRPKADHCQIDYCALNDPADPYSEDRARMVRKKRHVEEGAKNNESASNRNAQESSSEAIEDSTASESDEQVKQAHKSKRQLDKPRKRQKAVLEQRREEKRRKLMMRRVKRLVAACFFFFMAVAIYFIVKSPAWVFDGQQLKLRNNHLIAERNIKPIIAQYAHKPLYAINPELIADAIQRQYNIVSQVYVRRYLFPARLDVYIVEKKPLAEIYSTPTSQVPYALLSTDYTMIPLALYPYKPKPKKVNEKNELVRLVIPSQVTLDKATLTRLDEISYQLNSLPGLHLKQLVYSVDTIRRSKPKAKKSPDLLSNLMQSFSFNKSETAEKEAASKNGKGKSKHPYITLTAKFDETTVLLGVMNSDLNKRLTRLPALAPKILEFQKEISLVDLRWSEQITFRKRRPGEMQIESEDDILEQAEQRSIEQANASQNEATPQNANPKTKKVTAPVVKIDPIKLREALEAAELESETSPKSVKVSTAAVQQASKSVKPVAAPPKQQNQVVAPLNPTPVKPTVNTTKDPQKKELTKKENQTPSKPLPQKADSVTPKPSSPKPLAIPASSSSQAVPSPQPASSH